MSEIKWHEHKLGGSSIPQDCANYTQEFLPQIVVTRAPWWAIWFSNVQRHLGWFWIRRLIGNPHAWDEKAFKDD